MTHDCPVCGAAFDDRRRMLSHCGESHPNHCPTCGDGPFEGRLGVGNHHGEQHPEGWEDRFWSRADVGGKDECWWWRGAKRERGHGTVSVGGRMRGSHRMSYRIEYGEPNESVLHHCDNPPCVNPNHLYSGNQQDNIDDMWDRGRGLEGDDAPWSVLSEEEVVSIRERYEAGGVTQESLGGEYGVGQGHIGQIVRGDLYSSSPGPVQAPLPMGGEGHPSSKLTEDEVAEIRKKYAGGGVSQRDMADEYGLSGHGPVSSIVNGDTWPDAPGPIKGEDYE